MWATAILPIASYPVKETVFSSIRKPFSSNNGNAWRKTSELYCFAIFDTIGIKISRNEVYWINQEELAYIILWIIYNELNNWRSHFII